MTIAQCPSLAALLVNGQQVSHHRHQRGWIETPNGHFILPKASEVQFIAGMRMPFMTGQARKPHWFARLMGMFA